VLTPGPVYFAELRRAIPGISERMLSDPRFAGIPVIFTSATYRQDLPRPGNVRAFLSKPLLFKLVLDAVQQNLPSKETS